MGPAYKFLYNSILSTFSKGREDNMALSLPHSFSAKYFKNYKHLRADGQTD